MTSFRSFYEPWFDDLQILVNQLAEAPKPPTNNEENHNLLQLVKKIMTQYKEFYRVKSLAAQQDVFSIFSSPWSTSLERALHWVGGCRPTTIFHLIYTESSIVFHARFSDILRGIETGDLGDMSAGQMQRVSDLQGDTVREENAITSELSQWQDGAIDILQADWAPDRNAERLVEILEKADDLRLRTVTTVVELLTPLQAAEFLIGASDLQFGVRGWGLNLDHLRHGGSL